MSDAARAWLAARSPEPPAPLRARLDAALAELPRDAPVTTALGEAALLRLRAALALGDAREAAFELLAADALLTCALEAGAELGAETLEAVTEAYGPARIATLMVAEE